MFIIFAAYNLSVRDPSVGTQELYFSAIVQKNHTKTNDSHYLYIPSDKSTKEPVNKTTMDKRGGRNTT